MKTKEQSILSVAESVKNILNGSDQTKEVVEGKAKKVSENKKDFKPHMMYDPKTGKEYEAKTYEDHLKMADMGYVHEKPSDKEESNEFTKAAAKAKLAGEDEFEFDGKTYPTEISQDAAEKILGKKESVELEEGKFDRLEKKLGRINPETLGDVMDGKIKLNSAEKKEFDEFMKGVRKMFGESIDENVKCEECPYDEGCDPECELGAIDEAIQPGAFIKGGNAKVTRQDVDKIFARIFLNDRLMKVLAKSKAFKAGEESKGKKKNPYKNDTADFHHFELGTQSAEADM